MSELSVLEMARCAQINIENLKKMAPIIADHPVLMLIKGQVDQVVEMLEQQREGKDGE